jgi:RHS repeat-associated protein
MTDQRYYNSGMGRFWSPDPSMDNVDYSNPVTWNAYAYTNGDPINFDDPSGLTSCGDLGVVGGGTLRDAVLADTPQAHFIDLVWHEAGTFSQAGNSLSTWSSEFDLIAQAIWNRYQVVLGNAAVTGANGTVYSVANGNVGQLGYLGVSPVTNRLGTVRGNTQGEPFFYYPYGEERSNTVNGREKFATYFRDGVGQDYAEQRYYNSGMGRFWTVDPGGIKTAVPSRPSSWNRYAYVEADPANAIDPGGTNLVLVGTSWCWVGGAETGGWYDCDLYSWEGTGDGGGPGLGGGTGGGISDTQIAINAALRAYWISGYI